MINEEIAEGCRQRWAIEILWKFLKMHLKLDRLMTKNVKGVTIQIYTILIVYLILQLRQIPQIYGDTLLNKLRYVNLILSQEGNLALWANTCSRQLVCKVLCTDSTFLGFWVISSRFPLPY